MNLLLAHGTQEQVDTFVRPADLRVVEQRRADGRMRFDTVWKVFAGRALVREVTEHHRWHTLTTTRLAAESGLPAERITNAEGQPTAEITVLRSTGADIHYSPR